MSCHLTYTIREMSGASLQAVSSSDRKASALTHTLNAILSGRRVAGLLPTDETSKDHVLNELRSLNVPSERAELWSKGIDEERINSDICTEFAGKFLDPYQVEAIRRLTVAGGVLALGCGLGKTLAALCAVKSYQTTLKSLRLWVVCPLNAMSSWKPYLTTTNMPGWDIKLISMDSLHKLAAEPSGGVIIYDEAHLLGSSGARRTKAAHLCRISFDVGLCLTGTFLHGGVEKTLSMLDLAIPGAAGFASKWSAGEHFKCLVRKKIGARTVTEIARPIGVAKERLFAHLTRYVVMLSTASEAVRASLTIPDQSIHTLRLNEPWRPLHEDASHEALRIHAETGELPHAQEVAHALCRGGGKDKAVWLIEQLEGDNEPCVVYAHYHETLDAVCEALREAKITFTRIDGSHGPNDRVAARDLFRSGQSRVFVGQVVATGIGVDGLQDISRYSVSLDHCWRPDVYAQSLARTCRRGQKYETHHIDLVANKLQLAVVERIRAGETFDREAQEYQEVTRSIIESACNSDEDHTLPTTPPPAA